MDLTQLTAALSGLGPWGVALGIALTILGPKILARIKPFLPAPTPTPAKPEDPLPLVIAPSSTPLMDAALLIFRILARRKYSYLSNEEAAHKFAGDLVRVDDDETIRRAATSVKAS